MRKAVIDRATDEVRNIIVVGDPAVVQATVVKKVVRPARPEAQWVNKKTGETIIKAALPEESRHVFSAPGHGLRLTSGPFFVSGGVPPELDESTPYFVKILGPDEFLLKPAMDVPPVEITQPKPAGAGVTLTEAPYHPGQDVELIDDDGTAARGGKWNRSTRRFEPPPRPDEQP